MNKKIVIYIIVAAVVVIGVLSFVSSSNLPLNQNIGSNNTVNVPSTQTPKHYSVFLNDSAGLAAH